MNTKILALLVSISSGVISSAQTGSYSGILVQDDGAEIRIKANQTNQNPTGSIIFDESTGDNHFSIVYDGLSDSSGGKLRFSGYERDVMTLDRGGNVGIGTDSPAFLLDVAGQASVDSLRFGSFYQSDYITGESSAHIYGAAHNFRGVTPMYGSLVLQSRPNGNRPIMFINGASPAERMRIASNGFVGIGTDSPTKMLSVNGTIQAKEVIVETGWSDFVFEDSYRLKSLEEVEKHIEEHGHLPDVPSATVVESEGLSIGETQKIMMQKIEELTLYVIEQDKKNGALLMQMEAQQLRIQQLESN